MLQESSLLYQSTNLPDDYLAVNRTGGEGSGLSALVVKLLYARDSVLMLGRQGGLVAGGAQVDLLLPHVFGRAGSWPTGSLDLVNVFGESPSRSTEVKDSRVAIMSSRYDGVLGKEVDGTEGQSRKGEPLLVLRHVNDSDGSIVSHEGQAVARRGPVH